MGWKKWSSWWWKCERPFGNGVSGRGNQIGSYSVPVSGECTHITLKLQETWGLKLRLMKRMK